jgi:hypothetical protein
LSISVIKLKTTAGLDEIAATASDSRYPAEPSKLSEGWGSFADDEAFAGNEGLRLTYRGYKLGVDKNHNGTKFVGLRYYYDEIDRSLARRLGGDVEWQRISNRRAFDVLLLDEDEPDQVTALVSSRNDDEMRNYVRPALTQLVADEKPPGSLQSASVTEELEPDFFLWLLYKLHMGQRIAPNVKLSGITEMNGTFVGRRNHLSQGVDMFREDSLALVARNRSRLGPAKISIVHYAEPEGYFEVQLIADGGFQVYRKSKYDDEELQKLSVAVSGQRMVQDVWQTILPTIRATYRQDARWRTEHREQFVQWAKDELKKF